MKKHIANLITGLRILLSVILLFCPTLSLSFGIIYLLCGFSDMVDGTIARKTNSVSQFGSKLDTVADFVFMAVSLAKLLPLMDFTMRIWIWVVLIAIIKIINGILGFIQTNKLFPHTVLNKVTGLLMFLLPLTLRSVKPAYSVFTVCVTATVSALCETHCILKLRNRGDE